MQLLSMPGGSEWLVILLVVVLLFGGSKIPELMRGLGKGVREFKQAANGTNETKNEPNGSTPGNQKPASDSKPDDEGKQK